MENKKAFSEESLLRFSANVTLFIGLIFFISVFYLNIIEDFELMGLVNSGLIFAGTLSLYSILLVLAKISEKIDKK